MRRTLEEPIKTVKELPPRQLKPTYGSINAIEGPYYDPYDIHIHQWVKGPLRFLQNHREPVMNNTFPDESGNIKEYCSICHEINLSKEYVKSLRKMKTKDTYDVNNNIILNNIVMNEYNNYSKELSIIDRRPLGPLGPLGPLEESKKEPIIDPSLSIFYNDTDVLNEDEFVVVLL